MLRDAANMMLPSALGFHRERMERDIDNRDFAKLKADALGPLGLRPRYVRPGANIRSAGFDLEDSLRSVKRDFRLELRNNRNPARAEELVVSSVLARSNRNLRPGAR